MTVYYVDPVDGDDGNAGTSEGSGNAWQTLGQAASTAVLGKLAIIEPKGRRAVRVAWQGAL